MMLESVIFQTDVFCTTSHLYIIGCSKCSIIFLKDSRLDYCGFIVTHIHYR